MKTVYVYGDADRWPIGVARDFEDAVRALLAFYLLDDDTADLSWRMEMIDGERESLRWHVTFDKGSSAWIESFDVDVRNEE